MTKDRLAHIRSRVHMRDECPILQTQLDELCNAVELLQVQGEISMAYGVRVTRELQDAESEVSTLLGLLNRAGVQRGPTGEWLENLRSQADETMPDGD